MQDPQQPPLGPLVILPLLDDHNQGEIFDRSRRNTSDLNGSFPGHRVVPNPNLKSLSLEHQQHQSSPNDLAPFQIADQTVTLPPLQMPLSPQFTTA